MARRRDEVVTNPPRTQSYSDRSRGDLDAARIRDLQQRIAMIEDRVDLGQDYRPVGQPQIDYHQIAAMIQTNVDNAVARASAQMQPARGEVNSDFEDRFRALVDRVEKFQTEIDRALARRADETNATITRQIVDSANALHRRITEVAAAERERTESDIGSLNQRWQKVERDRDQAIGAMGDRWQALDREFRGSLLVTNEGHQHLRLAQVEMNKQIEAISADLGTVIHDLDVTIAKVADGIDPAVLDTMRAFADDASARLTANAQTMEVLWLEVEQMRQSINTYSDEFTDRMNRMEGQLDTSVGLDRELALDRMEDLEQLVISLGAKLHGDVITTSAPPSPTSTTAAPSGSEPPTAGGLLPPPVVGA